MPILIDHNGALIARFDYVYTNHHAAHKNLRQILIDHNFEPDFSNAEFKIRYPGRIIIKAKDEKETQILNEITALMVLANANSTET